MSEHEEATLTCRQERRRDAVRAAEGSNGLDYLEVSDDQLTLTVFFLGKAPETIRPENVRIEGGRRVRDLRVLRVRLCTQAERDLDDCMKVTVDRPGDFSCYRLCLIEVDEEGCPTGRPLPGFDPRYACLDFSFKAGCSTGLDCKNEPVCPPEPRVEPKIDYLAKDYTSFRQLILDRLALLLPDWRERHVPDVGIALVELLAYAGDQLSYYQDAVATEAYLDTARKRVSVRRHARLVDYVLHDGSNARAWVFVEAGSDVDLDPSDVYFITRYDDLPATGAPLIPYDLAAVPPGSYEVFEPVTPPTGKPIVLLEAHNLISLYTWGDAECCLPRGATRATLADAWLPEPEPGSGQPPPVGQEGKPDEPYEEEEPAAGRGRRLRLAAGDFLLFEEVLGPETGAAADADPARRHVVRLTRAEPAVDPLNGQPIVEVEWSWEDALPFPLCLSSRGPAPECAELADVSVARGNVLLVDHGRTVDEPLGEVPVETTEETCREECRPPEVRRVPGRFRPVLRYGPLTFREPVSPEAPAARLLARDPRQALPQVLRLGPSGRGGWEPRRDLLASGPNDRHFVVEMEEDGRAHLRFGDGELGRMPPAGAAFDATYRVGNGPAGNVGAGAIAALVLRRTALPGITLRPRNPLAARGGVAPEPLAEVKLLAPHTFRSQIQRAITADDYARLVERGFAGRVQRAAASLRWTGVGDEVLVAVDAVGGKVDDALLAEIAAWLERYRRIGHDVVVAPAVAVPLTIEMSVCVRAGHLRGHVAEALGGRFSSRTLPDGGRGLFHPDELTFGEGVRLSRLVAAAQAVAGVESVRITRFERFGESPAGELEQGFLPLGPLEIARFDNDPREPENGLLRLTLRGGR